MFHQNANKESRIITNAPMVSGQVIMPFNWEQRWPEFYNHITHFVSVFKSNAHDDAEDVITGIYERELAIGSDMIYGKRKGIRRR